MRKEYFEVWGMEYKEEEAGIICDDCFKNVINEFEV